MNSLMQSALGADWEKLPPALHAHHRYGATRDSGHLNNRASAIHAALLSVLRVVGDRLHWRQTITYPDRRVLTFNSLWVAAGGNQLIEFVNPVLGLQMAAHVEGGRLRCHGFRFVVKLGQILLPIREWLLLGRSSIVEEAVDETHFVMDFPLTYPLFGQVFRYSGEFEAS